MQTMRTAWVLGTVLMTGCAAGAPPRVASSVPQKAATLRDDPAGPPAATPPVDSPQGDDAKIAELRSARTSFEAFIARADGNPEYAAAVRSARTRIQDIDRMLIWLGQAPTPAQ